MNTTKILESEINGIKISSLPSRPTAPKAFGGKGYTSEEMKAAFDKLPLYIIERFNMLLDDISSETDGSLAAEIPTGIAENHKLKTLFEDIINGNFASYLAVGDETLEELKTRLAEENLSIEERLEICLSHIDDTVIDASLPTLRDPLCGEVVS